MSTTLKEKPCNHLNRYKRKSNFPDKKFQIKVYQELLQPDKEYLGKPTANTISILSGEIRLLSSNIRKKKGCLLSARRS